MSLITKIQDASIKLFPNSRVGEFLPFFEETMAFGGITNEKRAAAFIGQIGIECDNFRVFSENLNYSAQRLVEVWPSRFRFARPGEDPAMEIFDDRKRNPLFYDYDPPKLANFVYGGRNGNREEKYGDGWRFRGRGPKQITFASNYLRLTKHTFDILGVDFIMQPDMLLVPRNGMYGAAWFWGTNKLNKLADVGNIDRVTEIVNGGFNKLPQRIALTKKALNLLAA